MTNEEPSTPGAGQRRFAGRTCLVTGGGRGIGRAVAEALAAEGARVGVVARTAAQCAEVVAAIGPAAVALPGDVTDPDDCRRAVDGVREAFGRLSLLVNAAGISPVRDRAERHSLDDFRRIVDVNLTGTFSIIQAASSDLLDGGGAVVNVTSVLGTVASPRLAGYGASKAGVIQLTRTLAREWADRGVRVNAVCPAYVETELTAAMLAVPRLHDEIVAATPLGRLASLREVVGPVLFLGSDDASYVTGTALLVDGGMAA